MPHNRWMPPDYRVSARRVVVALGAMSLAMLVVAALGRWVLIPADWARALDEGGVAAGTDLVALGHTELTEFVSSRPDVAVKMLGSIARRLRRTNEALGDLVFTDVPGRVAKALLDLASRFGRQVDDGVLVAHDLTQEELAQLVGASRETVNKALADFASRGWLKLEARAVTLLDVERLQRRAR